MINNKFYIKFGWWEDLEGMINYFVVINVSRPKSCVSSLHLFGPRVASPIHTSLTQELCLSPLHL